MPVVTTCALGEKLVAGSMRCSILLIGGLERHYLASFRGYEQQPSKLICIPSELMFLSRG